MIKEDVLHVFFYFFAVIGTDFYTVYRSLWQPQMNLSVLVKSINFLQDSQ